MRASVQALVLQHVLQHRQLLLLRQLARLLQLALHVLQAEWE